MSAYLDGFGAESLAQVDALHGLRMGFIGSIGEAAALGTFLDEEIRITGTKQVPDHAGQPQEEFRDFDVFALTPMLANWQKSAPDALGPHPLDASIHAKMVGGIRAEIAQWLGMRDSLTEQIPGLPENAYRLVERHTASDQCLFTPILGVLRAIRLGFEQWAREEDVACGSKVDSAAQFHARFEAAAIPQEELLDDIATEVVMDRFLYEPAP